MKQLHRPDLLTWSSYHPPLRIDFNGFLWKRADGNVLVDPLPLSPEDERDLEQAGGAAWIVVTNSDHLRGARELAARTGARLAGPRGERQTFPASCERWLADGDEPWPGLVVRELQGSKTEGELALVLQDSTVLFGDLVRAHRADALMLLPAPKLRDREQALASLRRLRTLHPALAHVLVGDGWCGFRHGAALLDELLAAG
jgi:glyoxylase-like metal-dependent hydrolase (beta-lactamase superfamily II)